MARRLNKDFTYLSIIREAILLSPQGRATSSQIFNYVAQKHPAIFRESNSITWKGNIRQLLSKSPEFVKLQRDPGSRLHFWTYIPKETLHEHENTYSTLLPPYYCGCHWAHACCLYNPRFPGRQQGLHPAFDQEQPPHEPSGNAESSTESAETTME
jgi:hypothetical protein